MIPVIDVQETGKRIKENMIRMELTPKDVQKELGLTVHQSVYHWIHGRNLPTIDNLVVLSRLFGCRIDDLLVVRWV